MTNDLREWIVSMPKAEIHVHLEGTIGPSTLLELAARYDLVHVLPGDDVESIRSWMSFTSFPEFVGKYLLIASLLRSEDDFSAIVEACGKDMAQQGIRYREITLTPHLHCDFGEKRLPFETVIDGIEAGRAKAKERYGVEMRWVFDVPRNASFITQERSSYDPIPAEQTLRYALQAIDRGCVGFGLGGDEVGAPPEPFAHAFSTAKEAGLLSVPHAGETQGPASIWGAVRDLQADRIGHGVRAIEDPSLTAYLRDRQIPLEVNITSNLRLHVYPSLDSHPFARLDRMGLLLTINSDDPPLFSTTLIDEYLTVHNEFDYQKPDLARFARQAIAAAGVDQPVKETLLEEFDSWSATAAR